MTSLEFVLIGHPVAHSMSPAIHAAGYRELGLTHHYGLLDVPDVEALRAAIARVRSGALAGANVTVPWKREALALADRADPLARDLGAANVLTRDARGQVTAYNTDVQGLAEDVREFSKARDRVLVWGSGGAALAAVAAAKLLGASRVHVTARRFRGELSPETWEFAAQFRALGAELLAYPDGDSGAAAKLAEVCGSTDVVLQATSAGMRGTQGGDALAALVPFERLPAHALAYDLVYNPRETPFLRAAAARGLEARHGLGMLVRQASLAMQLWLGERPSFEALYRAADTALRAKEAQ